MKIIKIATRGSALAVAQTRMVMDAIRAYNADIPTEMVIFSTKGDETARPLAELGGKGAFTAELTAALERGEVDLCVHSLKDMPAEDDIRFPIVAVGRREDPRDVLVLPAGVRDISETSKPLGCSSMRRSAYLSRLYPDRRVEPVRGNLQTRLQKLDDGLYGGLVLAAAGLLRMGLRERIGAYFDPEDMLPACGQGIIAVQGRAGEDTRYLDCFSDADSRDMAQCERAFIRTLGGGCNALMAVHAAVSGDLLTARGMAADENGGLVEAMLSGDRRDAKQIGAKLAGLVVQKDNG